MWFCNRTLQQCPNSQKYCCYECEKSETIHDHKIKNTQIILEECKKAQYGDWSKLKEDSAALYKEVKRRYNKRKCLIKYFEAIATEEERKGPEVKLITKDYYMLKNFATKMAEHVDKDLTKYFLNKKARELIQQADHLTECKETYASLEYLKGLDLQMIFDHYHSVMDETTSHPIPNKFTRNNICDLYHLKVQHVRQLHNYLRNNDNPLEVTEVAE